MKLEVVEVLGLVGVVLVVSTGKVFDPLRKYLRGFAHKYNPGRWIADLISCSMCSGVWIGVIWALVHSWSWESVVVFSGFLSLVSYASNEILGLVGILTLRVSGGMMRQYQRQESVATLANARAQKQPRKVAPGDDITEDEADALLEQENDEADRNC